MKKVGMFEGKTHFSALVHEVSRGETILVTKNGKPIAKIVGIVAEDDRDTARAAMDRIRANRVSLGPGLTIRDLIQEGRRS